MSIRRLSKMRKLPCLLLLGFVAAGCKNLATVKVDVIDERTQLENQILGDYETLSEDFALVASVRAVDESGSVKPPPPTSKGKQRALAAMRTREFHRDDVDEFKKIGLIGERNDGLLELFSSDKIKTDQQYAAFVRQVIKEENDARLVLMNRVIEMNPGMKPKDLPAVQKVMAVRNRERAKGGHKIQLYSGEWITKSGDTE